jgi:hypothetical protein
MVDSFSSLFVGDACIVPFVSVSLFVLYVGRFPPTDRATCLAFRKRSSGNLNNLLGSVIHAVVDDRLHRYRENQNADQKPATSHTTLFGSLLRKDVFQKTNPVGTFSFFSVRWFIEHFDTHTHNTTHTTIHHLFSRDSNQRPTPKAG